MKELDNFCSHLLDKRIKTLQKSVDICFDDLTSAKDIWEWESIIDYVFEKTSLPLNKQVLINAYYKSNKRLKSGEIRKPNSKINTLETKEKIVLIDSEKKSNTITQSKHKNLNKPALALIDRYSLTDDDLDKLGIVGISDTMTVFDKIKKHCDKIESDKKMAEFSHLTK